jgi:hypothetical protein
MRGLLLLALVGVGCANSELGSACGTEYTFDVPRPDAAFCEAFCWAQIPYERSHPDIFHGNTLRSCAAGTVDGGAGVIHCTGMLVCW